MTRSVEIVNLSQAYNFLSTHVIDDSIHLIYCDNHYGIYAELLQLDVVFGVLN
jgi:hypothetical protein